MSSATAPASDTNGVAGWIPLLERHHLTARRFESDPNVVEISSDRGVVFLLRASGDGRNLPNLTARLYPAGAPVILVQAREAPDLAMAARACGIRDYLREPVAPEELIVSVRARLEESRSPAVRNSGASGFSGGERMVGESAPMQEVRRQIARIAATECNVLITGETGTGKELAAELIHGNGLRKTRPFVCVNCAAIPETLLESELFGYEKGAFTGAQNSRPGQLELADGGVLFLDEIGELSLSAQAKILRAIEGKEVQRLGRRTGIRVNIRIVCATNRDLKEEVRHGRFRADLYFRINVAHLHLPPLRDRKQDLRALSEYYFREFNVRMGLRAQSFSAPSWRSLLHHDWPGNVREFRNVVESSLVQLPFPHMRLAELPEEFHRQFGAVAAEPSESERLLAALDCHNWNRSEAAHELKWSRMTLYRKMQKYRMSSRSKAHNEKV